jgi:cell division protein FtsL
MNNVTQMVQKVRQAPWREQRQWIGLFLLGLVLVAMVAAVYLNVTVRTAIAGREIQLLHAEIAEHQRTNADLEIQLAGLTSASAMRQRAEALGFEPAQPDEVIYVVVPGYAAPGAVDMSVHEPAGPPVPAILPEYNESLFDWFTRQLASSVLAGGQP